MDSPFLTVATNIRAMFRRSGGPDAPRLYAGGALPAAAGLREEALASGSRSDPLLRLLVEVDRKLDAVLGYLQRESLHVEFPFEGRVMRLGGTGLRLECTEALSSGDTLEILLLLEEFPMRIVSVPVSVRGGSAEAALCGPPARAYDVDFTRLEEDEREQIIRFVFSEERKRIRREKDDFDPPGL